MPRASAIVGGTTVRASPVAPSARRAPARALVAGLAAALAALLLLGPAPARAQALRGSLDTTTTPPLPDDAAPPPPRAPAARPVDDGIFEGVPGLRTDADPTPTGSTASGSTPPGADDATLVPDPTARPRTAPARAPKAGPTTAIAPLAASGPPPGTAAVPARGAVTPDPRDPAATQRAEAVSADDTTAPLGLRGAGGMIWYPAVEISAGTTSNADGTAGGRSSPAWLLSPELVGRSDWSRHALEIALHGAFTGYTAAPEQNRPNYGADLRGRVDLGDQTRLDLAAGWKRERQSTSTVENESYARAPDEDTATASIGLTRDVGLLALTLRGDVERNDYRARSPVAAGSAGPSVEDDTRWVGAFRVGYGGDAPIRPFVELRVTARRYDTPEVAGLRRDTDGGAALVGAVFDGGPILRGEIAGGWGIEKPIGGDLVDLSGFLLDGRLTWSPTRLTVVRVTARTEFQPTSLVGSPGALYRDLGLAVDRTVARDVTATLGTGWRDKHYEGLGVDERTLLFSTGLGWRVNRELSTYVRADWSRSWTTGSATYDTVTVMTGIRIQR